MLKVKTITNIKNQGSKKSKGSKSNNTKKRNSKKPSLTKFIKEVQEKYDNVIKTKQEIDERAAIIIQRWFRRTMVHIRARRERILKRKKKPRTLQKSPYNKDIQSLRSNKDQDVIEK